MVDRSNNLPGPRTEDPSGQKSTSNLSDRLESWKEVAAYLKREVRTVQRWEKREGLPVHRHQHDERSSVFAYKAELDAWWNNGQFRAAVTYLLKFRRPTHHAVRWLVATEADQAWLSG